MKTPPAVVKAREQARKAYARYSKAEAALKNAEIAKMQARDAMDEARKGLDSLAVYYPDFYRAHPRMFDPFSA